MTDKRTPDELAEEGIGLIARGAFRASITAGNVEAAAVVDACITTLISMKHDFIRLEAKRRVNETR